MKKAGNIFGLSLFLAGVLMLTSIPLANAQSGTGTTEVEPAQTVKPAKKGHKKGRKGHRHHKAAATNSASDPAVNPSTTVNAVK